MPIVNILKHIALITNKNKEDLKLFLETGQFLLGWSKNENKEIIPTADKTRQSYKQYCL